MAVRIVTDSTADIPTSLADELGIKVVPLTVFFGDEAFLDGIELDNASFYRKLQESKALPRTSQPSPKAFEAAYAELMREGADAIISIHLSSKLSGTYQSACTGKNLVLAEEKPIPIEVVDTQSISAGMLPAILQAARDARTGMGYEAIHAKLIDRVSRSRILAILDTLEYVRRGGRIGGARALLGNMLSVKPIISLKDGEVVPVEQPRTRSKAYERVAQLMSDMGELESLVIAESSEEVGSQLSAALKTIYTDEIPRYKLGAVLGTHTGPGTVAIAVTTAK